MESHLNDAIAAKSTNCNNSEERALIAKDVMALVKDHLEFWIECGEECSDLGLIHGIMRDLFDEFGLEKYAVDVWISDYKTYGLGSDDQEEI
mgnify:CR=1 FL=1